MAQKNLTELVFILDKSGSMSGLEADTVGGYNTVLAQNRAMEGQALVSTVLFDHRVHVVHDRVPISAVKPLTLADYQPSGCTALLDAVGGAVKYHRTVQQVLPETHRAEHVLFVIATDGYENASKRFTYPQVKSLIEHCGEKGWEFVFLGASIDAAAEADRIGIAADRAVRCEATPSGTQELYETMAYATRAVRSGRPLDDWR